MKKNIFTAQTYARIFLRYTMNTLRKFQTLLTRFNFANKNIKKDERKGFSRKKNRVRFFLKVKLFYST